MNSEPLFSSERWERTPPAVQADLRALEASVAALEATVQQLREQRQQDSRTSSRPPSSEPPQALTQRPRREPTGRRPGGQPGHEGHARAWVPVEEVDVVIPVKPEHCRRCQHPLQGEDAPPQRHQMTEIPPVKPVVTEYQLPQRVCPACGDATRAELPPGGPRGECGPRVQAITALCPGASHLSKRTTQNVLADLLGVALGLGSMANLEQATAQAMAEPVAEARTSVQAQSAAPLDETGGREGPQRAWLWTAVTTWVTVFVVRRSRSGKVARELMGEHGWGWLVTERWSAYTWYPTWRRQLCGAHWRRDIEAMMARGGRSQEIGEALQAQARQMCHGWPRVRDGTLAHPTFARSMWPVRRALERLRDAGQTCGVPKTAGTCREILKLRQGLWTFVRHAGVEPTNNAAERALRPGVLWRKGSFGTQSPEGSRLVEAMMTVVATLKPPHRNVLDDVTAACAAVLWGEPAPALLPTLETLHQVICPAA
jgi:transposase